MKMKQHVFPMSRRSLLKTAVATALMGPTMAARAAEQAAVTVHKDPNCGCCTGWVQHLRDAGFDVRVEETGNLDAIRTRLGVPPDLVACHTAEVGGYLVEGHVPASAVRRVLAERPNARGLAVPGMPIGSPGMEGGKPQPYAVVLFGTDGQRTYMRFIGSQEIG